jgi:hypothetical protein
MGHPNKEWHPDKAYRAVLIAMLLLGMALRLSNLPRRYEERNVDEPGYLDCSLCLIEGIVPGYKAAPGGAQLWEGWVYAAAQSAKNLLYPHAEAVGTDMRLRPFIALNQALFDDYRDVSSLRYFILTFNLIFGAAAIWAACRFGFERGAIAGTILAGGLAAVLPLFVEYTCMSRPYEQAWCFAIMALCAAATARRGRIAWTAVFFGVAVGTRIEMLALAPLVLWEFWERKDPQPFYAVLGKLVLWTFAAAIITAPWLLSNIPGNLRAIGTVQFSTPMGGATPWRVTMRNFLIGQGLLLPAVLLLAIFRPPRNTIRWWVGVAIVFFLLPTILKSTGFGLHHKGYVMIVLIVGVVLAAESLNQISPRFANAVAVIALILPLVQCVRLIVDQRHAFYNGDAAPQWVLSHIQPGTRIYLERLMHDVLPTRESADVVWAEVNDNAAWQRKFASGLQRFNMQLTDLPRAMSEENLVQERGTRRKWFILGSRSDYPEPRFNIQVYNQGPVFGVRDVVASFSRDGGVLIWTDWLEGRLPPDSLGKPAVEWTDSTGRGQHIFVSADTKILGNMADK